MTGGDAALVSILTSFLTAVLVVPTTAYITTLLALRRFRSEKWWEKQLLTYEQILSELYDITEYYERELERLDDRGLNNEEIAEMKKASEVSYFSLLRKKKIGSFLISEQAAAVLYRFDHSYSGADAAPDWYQFAERRWQAAETAFNNLHKEARSELGPTPSFWGDRALANLPERIRNRPGHPDLGAPK